MKTSSLSTVNLSNSLPDRSLKITFILENNTQNPLEIEGLRTEVFISQTGQESGSTANIRLHAPAFESLLEMLKCNAAPLKESPLMLALSGAEVKIQASDQSHFLSLIFHGKIRTCHADFRPPHRFFEITAHSTLLYNQSVISPLSYQKPVWASKILEELCASQSISLENNDFNYLIQPPFSLNGTLFSQVTKIVNAQHGFFHFDPLQNKLLVAKESFSKQNDPLLLENKDLIGFPYCSDQLLSVRCLFQANFQLGQNISVKAAPIENETLGLNHQMQVTAPWNGQWVIHAFSHVLSVEKNRSKWETHLCAHRLPS